MVTYHFAKQAVRADMSQAGCRPRVEFLGTVSGKPRFSRLQESDEGTIRWFAQVEKNAELFCHKALAPPRGGAGTSVCIDLGTRGGVLFSAP